MKHHPSCRRAKQHLFGCFSRRSNIESLKTIVVLEYRNHGNSNNNCSNATNLLQALFYSALSRESWRNQSRDTLFS